MTYWSNSRQRARAIETARIGSAALAHSNLAETSAPRWPHRSHEKAMADFKTAWRRKSVTVARLNRQRLAKDGGNEKPADDFVSLIERATISMVMSSTCDANDEELAQNLYKRANDCMIQAKHSPFFGGTKTYVSREGIEVVRELVFERWRDELIARGYPMPKR